MILNLGRKAGVGRAIITDLATLAPIFDIPLASSISSIPNRSKGYAPSLKAAQVREHMQLMKGQILASR